MCRAGFQVHCGAVRAASAAIARMECAGPCAEAGWQSFRPSNQRSSSIFGDERTGEKALLFHGAAVDHLVERARGGLSDRFGGIED